MSLHAYTRHHASCQNRPAPFWASIPVGKGNASTNIGAKKFPAAGNQDLVNVVKRYHSAGISFLKKFQG